MRQKQQYNIYFVNFQIVITNTVYIMSTLEKDEPMRHRNIMIL